MHLHLCASCKVAWFSTVGGRLSEDSYLDGRHARGMALMAMAGGSTGLNYYMFFGGVLVLPDGEPVV